jgi:hypothetical protein
MSYIEEEQITQWHREEFEGQSDVVYRGRTDNTMANRKSTKWRSARHIHKTKEIHKLHIEIQNVQKVR